MMDCFVFMDTWTYDAGVDMGDGGSVDSGRPETPDTDESSEVSIVCMNVCFSG